MPGRHAIEMTGKKFGRLTVVGRTRVCQTGVKWNCVCECGRYSQPSGTDLRLGRARSCGCLRNELSSARFLAHNPRPQAPRKGC